MKIFKENKQLGLQCGINDDGKLFLGDMYSGYTMEDNSENREILLDDFYGYEKLFKEAEN